MNKDCMKKIGAVLVAIVMMSSNVVYAQDAGGQEQDPLLTESVNVTTTGAQSTETVAAAQATSSQNVTLDFKDADILLVMRLLSLKSGVNIVAGPEVTGTVTVRLNDVPWEKALDIVLRTYGYVYERDGNVIRVTTRENLESEDLVTESFVLNYSTAAEIEEAIKEIVSERGRIKSVQRTNTILVTDVATNIYKIGEIIKRLDRRTPQVFIDSKIIKTGEAVKDKLGIQWGTEVYAKGANRSINFPWKGASPDEGFPNKFFTDTAITAGTLEFDALTATLNVLKSYKSTKIVSNPRIITLSNKAAKVQVGSQYYIPEYESDNGVLQVSGYETRDTGVLLNVTPHVNDVNEILVELSPEVVEYAGNQTISSTVSLPIFNTTNATTQVLIKNRDTIVIGGLMEDKDLDTETKVPVLGDIPLVGKLFRSKTDGTETTDDTKYETLFFITVTIVDTAGNAEDLEDEGI